MCEGKKPKPTITIRSTYVGMTKVFRLMQLTKASLIIITTEVDRDRSVRAEFPTRVNENDFNVMSHIKNILVTHNSMQPIILKNCISIISFQDTRTSKCTCSNNCDGSKIENINR